MHRNSKKHQWKMWIMGAAAAAALTVPLSINTTARADDAATTATMSSPPIQISGTVEKYYTDRSGLVTALDLNATAGGVHKIRFAPSWARRLLDDHPVGSTLNGWVEKSDDGTSNLVSIGADRPDRFLTNDFHTGAERLKSRAWVWKDAGTETVTGELNKVIVDFNGEVLALELKDGTLVRVPRTVKNQEQGAHGSKGVAQLFKGAEVTAWGPQVWHARGDVSIYGQRIASDGLSINGKTVSAIGIQNLSTNASLLGSIFEQTQGENGEYLPFDASMERQSPPPTMMTREERMRRHERRHMERRKWRQDKMGMHDRVREQKEEKEMDEND
jgi:hypothetical protein